MSIFDAQEITQPLFFDQKVKTFRNCRVPIFEKLNSRYDFRTQNSPTKYDDSTYTLEFIAKLSALFFLSLVSKQGSSNIDVVILIPRKFWMRNVNSN